MAWMEYFTASNAVIYEGKGLAKPVFTTLALLIERADEDEKPTENEGWCFASEQYIADRLGMSANRVGLWIKKFKHDGWIVVEKIPSTRGGDRNRYRFCDNTMKRLEELKRDRNAERVKNPKKVRPQNLDGQNGIVATPSSDGSDPSQTGVRPVSEPSVATRSSAAPLLGVAPRTYSEQPRVTTPSSERSGGRGLDEKVMEKEIAQPLASTSGDTEKSKTKPVMRASDLAKYLGGETVKPVSAGIASPAPLRKQGASGGNPPARKGPADPNNSCKHTSARLAWTLGEDPNHRECRCAEYFETLYAYFDACEAFKAEGAARA